jgi:hypothetical protein
MRDYPFLPNQEDLAVIRDEMALHEVYKPVDGC